MVLFKFSSITSKCLRSLVFWRIEATSSVIYFFSTSSETFLSSSSSAFMVTINSETSQILFAAILGAELDSCSKQVLLIFL
jgi:hypothetical protein